MKIQHYKTEEEWLDARRGRIMGTKAGNLVLKSGKGYKMGFYELIAERVAIPPNEENVMDRGHRLELDALVRFEKETGKDVNKELVIIHRDDNENIAYSPDGFIGKEEDVEVKCLSSARHIEAWLTKEVPSDYKEQMIQGFVANDLLETRYMVFYDPRMPIDFFYLTINRADVQEDIDYYLALERRILLEVERIEKELTF